MTIDFASKTSLNKAGLASDNAGETSGNLAPAFKEKNDKVEARERIDLFLQNCLHSFADFFLLSASFDVYTHIVHFHTPTNKGPHRHFSGNVYGGDY